MEKQTIQKEEDKKNYELSFLLPSEDAARGVRQLLGQHKIDTLSEGGLKKINFAYKIKGLDQGYFQAITISSLPSQVKLLEHDLKTVPSVLRSLIISPSKDSASAAAGGTREERRLPTRKPQTRTPASPRPPKTLSNEALEKKIEEILQ